MLNLDKKDKQILSELYLNGRASQSELGKKCGVSKEMVNYRIKRFSKEEIITKIVPLIDFSILGYSIYRLHLRTRGMTIENREKMILKFKEVKGLNFIATYQGDWDISLYFYCKSQFDFMRYYDQVLEDFSEVIVDKVVTLIKSMTYLSPNYICDGRREEVVILDSGDTPIKLDLTGQGLIEELLEDGSKSLVDISNNKGLAVNTVKYNLNKLKSNKIIKGFIPKLNLSKLGYEHFKVLVILENVNSKKALRNLLLQEPSVVQIIESVGRYDLEFEAHFKETQALLNFLDLIKSKIEIKEFEILYGFKLISVNETPFN